MMEELDIKRPKGRAVWDINHGIEIANEIKYPVLVRPSYVLGGQGMEICHDEYNLVKYLESSFDRDPENPVTYSINIKRNANLKLTQSVMVKMYLFLE